MEVSSKSIKWDEEALLGRGCQGTVVHAGQFNGRQVAVKRILLHNAQLVQRELDALLSLRHPHIVKLYYVEKDTLFLKLALELCVATLADYCIGRYTGDVPEEMLALRQMLDGLSYIHSQKFVHRDIKPNNILIDRSGNLKIADFGFCKPVSGENSFSLSDAGKGTDGWIAPELLNIIVAIEENTLNTSFSQHATTAVDVFPLGCVFFYFLTKGKHPFGMRALRSGNILMDKYDLSGLEKKHQMRGLIKEMISNNPEQRPKLAEVLTRPMFNRSISTTELIKDDKKFANWIKSLKNRFRNQEPNVDSEEIKPLMMGDCEVTVDRQLTPATWTSSTRPQIFANQTFGSLQTIAEREKEVRRRPALNRSGSRIFRGFSDIPESMRQSIRRNRAARIFFRSEYLAEDEVDNPTSVDLLSFSRENDSIILSNHVLSLKCISINPSST